VSLSLEEPLKTPATVAVDVDVSMMMMVVVMVGDSGVASVVVVFVDLNFAEISCVSCVTDACKAVDAIDAFAIVLARVGRALVNVDIAVDPVKASGALALVGVEAVNAAAAVLAGVARAVVDVDLARETGVA